MKRRKSKNFLLAKEVERQSTGQGLLRFHFLAPTLVILCCIADAVNLFSLFDLILNNTPAILWVTVSASVIILEGTPLILGHLCAKHVSERVMKRVLFIAAGILLVVIGALIFSIRLASGDTLFTSDLKSDPGYSDSDEVLGPETTVTDDTALTVGQQATVFFLAMLTFLTSIFCFLIGYKGSTHKLLVELKARQRLELNTEVDRLTECIFLLQKELNEFDQDTFDLQLYDAGRAQISLINHLAKITARRLLCERLQSPQAVTLLMEENAIREEFTPILSQSQKRPA